MNKSYIEWIDYYENATKEDVIQDMMLDINSIKKKDKEIERLSEELGDANYTITQLHKVMDRHYVKKEDYDRLNNIIDELDNLISIKIIRETNEFDYHININDMVELKTRLLALKEGKYDNN